LPRVVEEEVEKSLLEWIGSERRIETFRMEVGEQTAFCGSAPFLAAS
jgi:hypothetical protein